MTLQSKTCIPVIFFYFNFFPSLNLTPPLSLSHTHIFFSIHILSFVMIVFTSTSLRCFTSLSSLDESYLSQASHTHIHIRAHTFADSLSLTNTVQVVVDGCSRHMVLTDTAGMEEFESMQADWMRYNEVGG